MSDTPSILRTPKEHFDRARGLAVRAAVLTIHARRLEIINPTAAARVKGEIEMDKCMAIYHVAKALEATALLEKIKPDASLTQPVFD